MPEAYAAQRVEVEINRRETGMLVSGKPRLSKSRTGGSIPSIPAKLKQ